MSISPAAAISILADRMAAKLECQLHIAVAKQGLHSFWIGPHADQKRCQTVANVFTAFLRDQGVVKCLTALLTPSPLPLASIESTV